MPRALLFFQHGIEWRASVFGDMFRAVGIDVVPRLDRPEPGDHLLIWNRQGASHSLARKFEAAKALVWVAENGYLGKHVNGQRSIALARGHHAGAGRWHVGGPQRWASLGVDLQPWRTGGKGCVILAQRGIGESSLRAPPGWDGAAQRLTGGIIRQHPGDKPGPDVPTLAQALDGVASVATWSSTAALQALVLGVPAFYGLPVWIGAQACHTLTRWHLGPKRQDADRLAMFQRLAWAMWSEDEVRRGDPLRANMRKA